MPQLRQPAFAGALETDFQQRVIGAFGMAGRRWLAELPLLLEDCAERWGLTIAPPFPELSYNYVAPAEMAGGEEIVLKLGVPNAQLAGEIAALRAYDSRGSVRLIDADADQGVLLLEKLVPGRTLSALVPESDEEATHIAARLMKRLWRPVAKDHAHKTVRQWALGFQRLRDTFQGSSGPFPSRMVAEAEEIYGRLLANTEEEVLLHGDLHHFNILSATRETWLAIDPKGVAGDPAYEAGSLLRNPLPDIYSWNDLAGIQSRRLDILADELQLDRKRIQEWAYAQLVLSAWWSYEDETPNEKVGGREWIPFAELIREA